MKNVPFNILIVDDSRLQRTLLAEQLAMLGHKCVQASDGCEALQIFEQERPNLVLSDVEMPGMTGMELCRKIRALESQGYSYFIFLSNHNDLDYVVEGMRSGADDYLGKPVELKALEACLVAARRVLSLYAELAARGHELERLNQELFLQSRVDSMTGLWNRQSLTEDLVGYEDRATRYQGQFCVALLDVDNFKTYNDVYGHPLGDKTLVKVAQIIADEVRTSDRAYRYGGEEFLIVFCDQTIDSGVQALERIRKKLQQHGIVHEGNPPGVVTISAGAAQLGGGATLDSTAAIKAADEALYRAKELGRNRTVPRPPDHPTGEKLESLRMA